MSSGISAGDGGAKRGERSLAAAKLACRLRIHQKNTTARALSSSHEKFLAFFLFV